MNVLSPPRAAPALHDLLGVSFVFNSAVQALAWDRDFACFGLADGAVAILRAHWQGAPGVAPRPGGGLEMVPASGPPAPPAIFPLHKGGVLALAGDPLGGIVSGGADGFFHRLADGEVHPLEKRPRRRTGVVAAGRGGRRAFATGRQIDILGPEGKRLTMPAAVTALRYDPAGLHLAIGHQSGVSLEACGIRDAATFETGAPVIQLAWRQDGGAVAAASDMIVVLRDREAPAWTSVAGMQSKISSLAFMADGALLIAGQDFLVFSRPAGALENARPGLRAPAAAHPRLSLFAAADAEGAIWLGRPGAADLMLLREPGAAPVFLDFSPDGEALAFAADDGEAGTVILPGLLFRQDAVEGVSA